MIQVCGDVQVSQVPAGLYRAKAENGQLGPGWSSVSDPTAVEGKAATVASGSATSYRSDLFGDAFNPTTGRYDVWYRVRVRKSAGATAEMVLGLWDDQNRNWAASTTYAPDQLATQYQWLKVAAGISPSPGHTFHFLAAATLRVSTDWYVDEAVMLPTGSAAPAS
jgi:hypothetical protein